MAAKSIELANLFATVAQALSENEDALNRADEFNHDHGTNMVTTFHIIADAVREKQGSSNSEALSYAAQQLQLKGTGGSARLYGRGAGTAGGAGSSGGEADKWSRRPPRQSHGGCSATAGAATSAVVRQ
jgi:hypothetical protein